MPNIKNLSKSKVIKWFLKNGLIITCLVLIIGLGIVFLAWLSPGTTIIGEDITTRNITVSDELEAKTDRTATFVVAALNSSPQSKAQADFVADGIDDQVEIQAAIDALPAVGGKVLLKEGTFHMAHTGPRGQASIVLHRPNTILSGVGWSTVLRLKDGAGTGFGQMILLVGSASPSLVRNLTIDGNKANNPDLIYNVAGTMGYRGVGIWDNTGSVVDGIKVLNMPAHGIEIQRGEGNRIANNQIFNNGPADGIGMDFTRGNIIANNFTKGGTGDGIDVGVDTTANSVVGNTSIDDAYGITVMGNENAIQGNIIIDSRAAGILLIHNASRNIVKGNVVRGGNSFALEVRTGGNNLFLGNILHEPGQVNLQPIIELYNTHSNLIKDNWLRGGPNSTFGIRIWHGSSNNTIRGNNISGVRWHRIRDTEMLNTWTKPVSDFFMDVLAASPTHIHPAITPDGLEHTDVTSPDVPRNTMIRITNTDTVNAQTPSGGNIVIHGVDTRGNLRSETLVVPAISIPAEGILDVFGSKAFATVTSVDYYSETNTNIIVSVGISDKLGLSNVIIRPGDVFKVRRGTTSITIGAVDPINGTVNLAPITTGDDITIWYRSALNIIN